MFKIFSPKPVLVEETSLARFVHHATSAEKRDVYNRVIREAADKQREVIKMFHERRTIEKNAHA